MSHSSRRRFSTQRAASVGSGSRAREARPVAAVAGAPARRRAARAAGAAPARRPARSGSPSTSRTRPRNGAVERGLHLHALDDGHDVARLDLVAGADTGIDTTTAGARLRTSPPSSREIRCGTPSTSTSRSAPWSEVSVRWVSPPQLRRRSCGPTRSTSTSIVVAVDRRRGGGRGRPGDREAVAARRGGAGRPCARCRRRPAGARAGRTRRSAPGRRRVAASLSSIAACSSGDVGVAHRDDLAAQLQPVEPGRVELARAHLGAVEQLEQEALVRGAAVDDHRSSRRARGAGGRAPRRGRAPQAMTLAIIESNSAGMTSPSATPVSTRTPGPVGSRSSAMRPGAGAKPSAGSSAFSRASIAWPRGARRLALEPPAGGDVRAAA